MDIERQAYICVDHVFFRFLYICACAYVSPGLERTPAAVRGNAAQRLRFHPTIPKSMLFSLNTRLTAQAFPCSPPEFVL